MPPLDGGELADRFGALDPSALYQGLKRFLRACAKVNWKTVMNQFAVLYADRFTKPTAA